MIVSTSTKERVVRVVAVSMGYGHWRAAYPFLPWAEEGRILTADAYPEIPIRDRKIWRQSERFYNFISRLAAKGFLGRLIFSLFDCFQRVHPSYGPRRPTLQLKSIYRAIRSGWGRDFISRLQNGSMPLLTTFFPVAYMAEYWNYPGPIYLVITDTDVSRAWAPYNPAMTRIIFLAPTKSAERRLQLLGVPRKQVFLTGFPLPGVPARPARLPIGGQAGGRNITQAVSERLKRLDPNFAYRKAHDKHIRDTLGSIPSGVAGPPRLLFSLGGAGAQVGIASDILRSVRPLLAGKIRICFAVGRFNEAVRRLHDVIEELDLSAEVGKSISILADEDIKEYIKAFTEKLEESDILWTKPSELSFYAALGIPIIMASPIGSHEERNRAWLIEMGAAVDQGDPRRAHEWLPPLMKDGTLAACAVNGFMRGNRSGLQNILDIVFNDR